MNSILGREGEGCIIAIYLLLVGNESAFKNNIIKIGSSNSSGDLDLN